MEMKVVMMVVGLFLVGSSWCASNPQSKSINAALRAPWSGTPLLMEAGELLCKYEKENFWYFVDKWSSEELSDRSANKDCFGRILHVGRSILKGPLESVFHLSLMLRIASPKLLVYRQLAQESLLKHQAISEQKVPDGGIAPPQTSFQLGKQVTSLDRWSISSNPLGLGNKCCWVDVGSNILVDESELTTWLNNAKEMKPDSEEIEIFEFDHTYPGFSSSKTVAVLYGALGTSCFHSFHSHLAGASKQGLLRYVFRPVLPSGCEKSAHKCSAIGASGTIYLGGYGVELALKNMEYKAIDDSDTKKGGTFEDAQNDDLNNEARGFIFSKLLERKPDLASELVAFRDYLLSSGTSETLNAWELKDLGYQTAQMILHASEPLQLMQEINQNFPNLASSLSCIRLNETVKEEISRNQRIISPGNNLLALNGALLNPENIDLYSLIDLVFGELSVADAITKVKVPSKFIKNFIQIPDPSDEHLFRLDFRSDHHVHYLNNLEKDSMYKRWRSNLQELLMPVFPGQLRYVRKNLYHAVYVIDPASSAGLEVVETIIQYHSDSVPMRFGLIMVSTECLKSIMENEGDSLKFASESSENQEDVSSLIFRLFLHLKHNYGSVTAFQFLVNVNKVKGDDGEVPEEEVVEITHVEEAFYEILKSKAKVPPEEILSQLEKGTEYKDQVMQSSLFVYKLGLSHMLPCLLMNGLFFGPSQVESAALTAMNEELPRIQEAVYYGQIKYNTDVLDKFLKENGYTRYNPQFFVKAKDQKHVPLLDVTEKGSILSELKFLHSPGSEDDIKSVTHLVVVDVLNFHGFSLLQQAIRYLVTGSTRGRVGILFNVPSPTKPSQHLILLKALMASLNLSSRRSKVPPFLQRLLSWYKANVLSQLANAAALESEEIAASIINLADSMGVKIGLSQNDLVEPVLGDWLKNRLLKEQMFVLSQLGLKPGSNAVITNGKVFVQEKDKLFVAEDFSLVESMEVKRKGKPIVELIEKVEWEGIEPDELTSDFLSNAIMAISSIMAMRNRGSENARFDVLQSDCSAVIRQPEHSVVHIDAVIDPLSSVGQRITPLLVLLQDWFQPSMRIFMNPMDSVAELPLKNFYRYVVPRKDAFIEDGWLQSGPKAVFLNMPLSKTLTMNLDVPEPWLVEPVKAVYDLDNIVLEKLGEEKSMYAVFELEALMLTGHCFERNKDPPRGLQLLLGTRLHQHMVDTIVMANLGYWQLKAAPGIWTLRLAPGRSSTLYTFDGPGEGTDSGPLFRRVVIKDLRGEVVHSEVIKRKGKEQKNVLDLDAEGYDESSDLISAEMQADSNFMKWATELITGSKESQDANGKDKANGRLVARQGETVNIFSVASGHLYERFLKIMILSVLKNTRRPVKFWFIKNYLSPQFKDVIPLMAKYYGFDYELVTYKWPTWLHKQTEKQRLIWAYKILFLDVLFPLSLKKVIFVDADQIVRTDMGDLYDLDIKGKPLAYTPFCDNNKDMDGYRFWKQGFWKDHLRGKPYHISALYVVDLVKFRQTAAGDTLRVVYETLSKDPGSLANLDQDLPNYAQHTVPIFSLPQEWLWCESWCGNSTKSKAKTIDLCNNPMTKEPKLEGAKRIVSEWLSLDLEAREVTDRVVVGAEDGQNNPVSVTISDDNDADRESASEL